MTLREPVLHTTPILSLRPTQITLGMVEVHQKRDAWRQKSAQDLTQFLESHMVPTIVGLGGAHYLIDHHHLARALYETGVESVFVTVVADLSRLTADHFWNMMDFHGWTHPYDGRGRRRPFSDLPRTVKSMEDDPYRSLAGELRTIGGFAKEFDAVLGIPLGRFPPPAHQAEGDQGRFQRRVGASPRAVEDPGRRLPARMVRPQGLRPGDTPSRERQEGKAQTCGGSLPRAMRVERRVVVAGDRKPR